MKRFIKFLALSLVLIMLLSGCDMGDSSSGTASDFSSNITSSNEPIPEDITVTVGSMGDYLLHTPLLTSYKKVDGSYDFSDIFKYVTEYHNKFDYFVGNLETTFGGDNIGYKGNWVFNSPDSFVNALIASGVDMVCTANNHSYDSSSAGFNRTMQILEQNNLPYFGSHPDGEKNYKVIDINGIKIGMINYTYQDGSKETPTLNGITISAADRDNINTFSYNYLEDFYSEMQSNLENMYNDGAEAIMLYIHWGNEYHREANSYQKQIAQKMCDLGVDVIVGGHPHVIEPVDVLSSDISGKQTVCIYSVGNALSNQRIAEMPNTGNKFPHVKTGTTEDGVIFSVSFTKKGTGEVYISAVDAIPTWVNMYYENGVRHFQIIPLDTERDFNTEFNLKAVTNGPTLAMNSYNRTMDLLKDGLEKFGEVYKTTDTRNN